MRFARCRTLLSVTQAEITPERFAALFETLSPRVYAYVRRRCDLASAQDIVADTFLVAWRRRQRIPADPLPWLLRVASNTIANHQRGERRWMRAVNSLGQLTGIAGASAGADHQVVQRENYLTALAALTEKEREALLLVAWDGLNSRDAAIVAGCSTRSFEVRLSRARARLVRELAAQPELPPSPPHSDDLFRPSIGKA